MIKATEKQIETTILQYLNLQAGCFAFKVNTVGVFDHAKGIMRKNFNPFLRVGTSDILGVYRGVFFAFEVKTPVTIRRYLKRPTQGDLNQKDFLDSVIRAGGIGKVVCSVDDVIGALKHAGKVTKNLE